MSGALERPYGGGGTRRPMMEDQWRITRTPADSKVEAPPVGKLNVIAHLPSEAPDMRTGASGRSSLSSRPARLAVTERDWCVRNEAAFEGRRATEGAARLWDGLGRTASVRPLATGITTQQVRPRAKGALSSIS